MDIKSAKNLRTVSFETGDREIIKQAADICHEALCSDKNHPDWYKQQHPASAEALCGILSSPAVKPAAARAAFWGVEPAGFALGAVKRQKTFPEEDIKHLPGYLLGISVKPSFQNLGIGKALLSSIETFMISEGKTSLKISRFYSPAGSLSVMPGSSLYRFLVNNGFSCNSSELQIYISFRDFSVSPEVSQQREKLKKQGIRIMYCDEALRDSFSRMMETSFKHWWYSFYKSNMKSDSPAGVLVAVEGSEVVGFTGPIKVFAGKKATLSLGVAGSHRSRGIGRVLANMWALELKKLGALESLVSTGSDNFSAQKVYFDMGFEKVGEYCSDMTKPLS